MNNKKYDVVYYKRFTAANAKVIAVCDYFEKHVLKVYHSELGWSEWNEGVPRMYCFDNPYWIEITKEQAFLELL